MVVWELTDKNGQIVQPRTYSNCKTQESVVNEVVDSFDDNKFVVLLGGVGTGKSAIALHVIKHFNRSGIIVVPTKVLEHQYQDDYCGDGKYHIPDLDVEFMVGKGNFKCPWSGDRWSCTHSGEPCNRPLNKDAEETRLKAAYVCKYWSPVYPSTMLQAARKYLDSYTHTIHSYTSTGGDKAWLCASEPCPYYLQFKHYVNPCALLMNAAKWDIETAIERKPAVEIEIIDEADEFLDGLSYQTRLDTKMFDALAKENTIDRAVLKELETEFEELVRDNEGYEGKLQHEIMVYVQQFVKELEDCPPSSSVFDKYSKLNQILENALHAYINVTHNAMVVFMPRPDITLKKIFAKSKRVLFMSATMQSKQVLKEIFGIEPHIVVAEDTNPGVLKLTTTGQESAVTYQSWQQKEFQQRYHKLLSHIVNVATKPCLVQVHAKKYVPPEHAHRLLDDGFVNGVWWSTRTDRGIDLPDEKCRSIVVMKYPLPDMNDVVLKTMRQLLGDGKFWSYMNDMATRQLIQQCGRGVRSADDWVEIYSPDSKCFATLMRSWNGKKVIERARVPAV